MVLARELDADRADGLHHDCLELVRDLGHEAADLFHESLHAGLTARLGETAGGGTHAFQRN